MSEERFLVTGGTGCIGSWVVRNLLRESVPVTVLTSGGSRHRLRLILTDEELDSITWVHGDVTDIDELEAAGRACGITTIVHLAGLQVPFCAADPLRGGRINVLGTLTMFELARRLGIGRLTYASSAAVYGPADRYAERLLPAEAPFWPTTHYGVFKVANELGARVYWETEGIASIGLRPHSVYGPGRDQGMTSKPTLAMIAASAGRPYRVSFGGRYQFQYVDDVAKTFIRAARAPATGAAVFSLGGPATEVREIIATILDVEPGARGGISCDDRPLALPEAFDGSALEMALGNQQLTPLRDGVHQTIDAYRRAIRDGVIDEAYLDRALAG